MHRPIWDVTIKLLLVSNLHLVFCAFPWCAVLLVCSPVNFMVRLVHVTSALGFHSLGLHTVGRGGNLYNVIVSIVS